MKDIIIGRENISATIFVPYDCDNKCNFCTTKRFYRNLNDYHETIEKIGREIKRLSDLGVTTFTLTGGEPLADLEKCKVIIELIKKYTLFPEELVIFLNTSLPKGEGADEIINFLNDPENHINGISVSRHRNTWEEDLKLLRNVFEDELLTRIEIPVRINCLVTKLVDLKTFVDRFEKVPNVSVNFRANYMHIRQNNLHVHDDTYKGLQDLYTLVDHTQCNVCDTDIFVTETSKRVHYHKGIFTTTIEDETSIEINDFVIDMFGDSYIDWLFEDKYRLTNEIILAINNKYI